jgi:hypothetical protein
MSRTVGIRFASTGAVLSLTLGDRSVENSLTNRHPLLLARVGRRVQPVERTNPEGVDYGWVMQVTFVVTILVGAPVVAVLSTQIALPDWGARAAFAIRVGAVIWFLTAAGVYLYARRTQGDPE